MFFTTEKRPKEMPDWNLLCLLRITSNHINNVDFVGNLVLIDTVTKPYTSKVVCVPSKSKLNSVQNHL